MDFLTYDKGLQYKASFGDILNCYFFLSLRVNVNASDMVREGYKEHSWSGTNTGRLAEA
jgi:hypothetical protein